MKLISHGIFLLDVIVLTVYLIEFITLIYSKKTFNIIESYVDYLFKNNKYKFLLSALFRLTYLFIIISIFFIQTRLVGKIIYYENNLIKTHNINIQINLIDKIMLIILCLIIIIINYYLKKMIFKLMQNKINSKRSDN